ncbi:DUF2279 domain-containing protein [Aquaticitalea lipolytica]|uniref:DUF2279 domain-containing protein n=1 Tax=Aquaticitalea lipolytica TaxID=1247562 RepID=A0A8J2TSK0_9FLAO|nr:DUF2279 domain-containing protein [Aquaticitalea lipolytica]GFZ86609.1 DUF2279 domain-containing protein [Aquaticitalea lipolytica]
MCNIKHICIVFFVTISTVAQSKFESFLTPSDTLNLPRRNAVIISESSTMGLSLLGLNQLWYADYPRSKFHTLNDADEWLQMDKVGHVFSSYQIGRAGANILNWSGVSKKNQLVYGSTLGFTFLTAVEVFDGFSEEWGFSWSDMAANAAGTGLYVGQELLWEEQRITLKYSFHQTKYAPQRPDKLGEGFIEEMLKDYNGQTYWLSANVHSFFKESQIPKWLNVAIGYGADGMLTGKSETVNNLIISHQRKRQFYLSLDVDLSRIETKSHVLKSIFEVFNVIKVPFPTVELDDRGVLKVHPVYF